ncbi:hypothetical protein [Clostridium aminobutyricum]|uniref:Uncharacterized protein n=1 Tax=Clostridium aminobutyricum TaxID=33953 RepID=A0A939D8B9_CLOAM|nr:hypothetical protein [Clostridium aminobutyricum]MBN7772955.1 hypothetical protein [Clostridium aminobutyricum]
MDIRSFQIKIDKKEAEHMALDKGGFLWNAVFSDRNLTKMKRHFIEFKLMTFEATYQPTWIERYFKHKTGTRKQLITMLANGSTGSVAWVDSLPEVVTIEDVEDDDIQLSDQEEDLLIKRGKKIATQVIHRHIGGVPNLELMEIESVFRPYWIAFYGEVIVGNKVRYKPIAADGCGTFRTR